MGMPAFDRGTTRRWNEWLDRWRNDLRVAVRALRRTPTFTISTVAILALTIGSATAIFTVYKVVLVDRLPVTAQERIVVMHTLDRKATHLDVPYAYLDVLARDSAIFRGVAGVAHAGAQPFYLTSGSSVLHLAAAAASPNFFDVLGTAPSLGRFFRAEDGSAGAPVVMVLSYGAWQRQFGGDSSAVGRVLRILYDEKPARIIGVAPPGLEYPAGIDAWVAWRRDSASEKSQVDIIARLQRNVSLTTAKEQLLALTQRVSPFVYAFRGEKLPPHAFDIYGVSAQSFASTVLGGSRWTLIIIAIAVGTLLLIACVNVGSLVLVRLLDRTREIAIRRAIGASYSDLVRLFVLENGIIAATGATLGFATAVTLLRVFAAVAPSALPRREMITLSGAPLVATAAISLGAFLIFGLGPSVSASRLGSFVGLRADSRSGTSRTSTQRARRSLVAAQIALALVMLTGATLVARSLAQLQSMDLGYSADHLSILTFDAPQSAMPTPERVAEIAKELVTRFEATPGVTAASPIENLPFKGQSLFLMKLAPTDQPMSERERSPFVPFEFVGPDYFRTFAIPIRRGRAFVASDTKGSDKVVIVNETLARQLWPNQDAVGKRLVQGIDGSEWIVVGVASDTHFRELKNVGPVVYFEWEQVRQFWSGFVGVRSGLPLSQLLPALRAAAYDVNPALALVDAQTMDHLLDAPMAQPRMSTMLLICFSLAALLLAVIGLYGVMSSAVRQQTRDIGVRIALGATPADVRRLLFGDAIRIVGIGVVTGLLGSLGAGRLLASQLFNVSPLDPMAVGAAAGLLVVTALVATYAPVRRATRIDPVEALRAE
jgi:predicted permease